MPEPTSHSALPDSARLVITGLGCVSPTGLDVPAFWDSLQQGRSALRMVRRTAGGLQITSPAAEIEGFALHHHVQTPHEYMLDPFAQYALVAAQQALRDSGWDYATHAARTGIVLGCTSGGDLSRESEAARVFGQGKLRCPPVLVARTNHQAAVGIISMHFGLRGPSFIAHSGCASGTHAVAQAWLLLKSGLADYVLCGGCEATVTASTLYAFRGMGVVAQDTCRPFCRTRSGMALSEGAGVLALERLSSARARGARIYAELAGISMNADAQDPVNPSVQGAALAMQNALDCAALQPAQIGYINAHGTGTQANDAIECAAIRQVFGSHAQQLAVSSTKAVHGHALGASGAFEAIACCLAMQHGMLPPTANHRESDPDCGLDVIPNQARAQQCEAMLSNSFALGGLNSCLAFKRYHEGH